LVANNFFPTEDKCMSPNRKGYLRSVFFILVTLLLIGRNAYRHQQETALQNAVRAGQEDHALTLLSHGVSANQPAALAELCAQALRHKEPRVVRVLLQRNIYPTVVGTERSVPALVVAVVKCPEVVPLLLAKGADVNARDDSGVTALYTAVSNHHPDLVSLLLDHGADANVEVMPSKMTPLCRAAQQGNIPLMSLLLAHGAHINAEPLQSAPLVGAVRSKQPDALRFLLERGANQEAKNNALIYALEGGGRDAMRLLLKYGAHPSLHSPAWLVALGQAHSRGNRALLALLRPLGISATPMPAEREARNEKGQTPLLVALSHSQRKEARYWVAQEADVNARDGVGRTPVLEAVEHCPNLAAFLLAKRANPNVLSAGGDTPLKLAVLAGNTPLVRELLKHGADANQHPPGFHSVLYFALKHKQADIVTLLQHAGGKGRF
jgi:uncharacterized protein